MRLLKTDCKAPVWVFYLYHGQEISLKQNFLRRDVQFFLQYFHQRTTFSKNIITSTTPIGFSLAHFPIVGSAFISPKKLWKKSIFLNSHSSLIVMYSRNSFHFSIISYNVKLHFSDKICFPLFFFLLLHFFYVVREKGSSVE